MELRAQASEADVHSILLLGPGGQATLNPPEDTLGEDSDHAQIGLTSSPADRTGAPLAPLDVGKYTIQGIPSSYSPQLPSVTDASLAIATISQSPVTIAGTDAKTNLVPASPSAEVFTATISRMITIVKTSEKATQTSPTAQLSSENSSVTLPETTTYSSSSTVPSVAGTTETKALSGLHSPVVIAGVCLAGLVGLAMVATLLSWISRQHRRGLFRSNTSEKLDKWGITELTLAPSEEKNSLNDKQSPRDGEASLTSLDDTLSYHPSSTMIPLSKDGQSLGYPHHQQTQSSVPISTLTVAATPTKIGMLDGPYPTARPLPLQLQHDDPFHQSLCASHPSYEASTTQGRLTVANLAPGDISDGSRANSRLGHQSSPWMSPPSSVPLPQLPEFDPHFGTFVSRPIQDIPGSRNIITSYSNIYDIEAEDVGTNSQGSRDLTQPRFLGPPRELPDPWAPLNIRPKHNNMISVSSIPSEGPKSLNRAHSSTSLNQCNWKARAGRSPAETKEPSDEEDSQSAKDNNQTVMSSTHQPDYHASSNNLRDDGRLRSSCYKSLSASDSGKEGSRSTGRRQLFQVIQRQEELQRQQIVGELSRCSSVYSSLTGWSTDISDEERDDTKKLRLGSR
ncbi:hypothetical protein FRC03_011152 [Tulasnella sp. 419]|nr:hypothetical protein FRC03_011152 [Tulasnella sp. 419]